jgi:hypothetical protein
MAAANASKRDNGRLGQSLYLQNGGGVIGALTRESSEAREAKP